jgi:hypothetical protein
VSLNFELRNFIENWLTKADKIYLSSLETYFDKFFTLYVVYNRLYAEATFSLARMGRVDMANKDHFPDVEAATNYILQFLSARYFVSQIIEDKKSDIALKEIVQLIRDESFYIKLDMVTGNKQRNSDLELLEELESENKATKGKAILETIYSIRCNMFHGHKGFEPVQAQILSPVIVLLRKIIDLLKGRLDLR